jgi:N-acetylneuraminic acid mutarotase
MVTGGMGEDSNGATVFLDSSECLDDHFAWSIVSNKLNIGRFGHTANLLRNGTSKLVTGGFGSVGGSVAVLKSCELYLGTTNQRDPWKPAGMMGFARAFHTATLVNNGSTYGGILVAGGYGETHTALDTIETYDADPSDTNPWYTVGGKMQTARYAHSAVTLADGRIMFMGGRNEEGLSVATVDICDLRSVTTPVVAASNMSIPRSFQSAVKLTDNRILVIGGLSNKGTALGSAELYTVDTGPGKWVVSGNLTTPRAFHAAAKLDDGRLFVADGFSVSGYVTESVEIIDFAKGKKTADNIAPLGSATATLVNDGGSNSKVLLVGLGLPSAQLYDPALPTGAWSSTPEMSVYRNGFTATLLNDGTVLVAGGSMNKITTTSGSEVYFPKERVWRETKTKMLTWSGMRYHTATLVGSTVIVMGGEFCDDDIFYDETHMNVLGVIQLFDTGTQSWTAAPVLMPQATYGHAATLLRDGRILVTGGRGQARKAFASAMIYDPAKNTWSSAGSGSMKTPRYMHTAILLNNGMVLVTGGCNSDIPCYLNSQGTVTGTAELFDPVNNVWLAASDMNIPRFGHAATLLDDGRVAISGGYTTNKVPIASCEIYGTGQWTSDIDEVNGGTDYCGKLLNQWKRVFETIMPGEILDFSAAESNPQIVEATGYLPLMLPFNPLLTTQHVFNAFKKQLENPAIGQKVVSCLADAQGNPASLDDLIASNDRDPITTIGGYVTWVFDNANPDPDCVNMYPKLFRARLANGDLVIPTTTLLERLLFELYYHMIKEQSPAVDDGYATFCSGTVLKSGRVPLVNYFHLEQENIREIDINEVDMNFGQMPEIGARRVFATPPLPLPPEHADANTDHIFSSSTVNGGSL